MEAAKHKHKNIRKLMGLAALFFLLPLSACGGQNVADVPPLIEPENVSSDTAIVKRDEFYRVRQYRAYLRAHTQEVYFGETRLNIKEIDVRAGQSIQKGDKIAELDAEDIEKAIAEQEEYIRHLKIVYDHENVMRQYDIELAGVRLQAAEHDADARDLDLQRVEVQKQNASLAHQREEQRLELQNQEKKLEELRAELGLTVITAPFDGVVVYVDSLRPGSAAIPFKPVAYIADTSHIYVEYNGADYLVTSGDMTAQIGDAVYELEYVPLDAEEQLKYVLDGRVPPAKMNIIGDVSGLTVGQFAAIYVKSDIKEDALMVPVNAVYTDTGELGAYVYVMQDGVKELRQVKLGTRNDSFTVILDGLAEGEEVFVKQ